MGNSFHFICGLLPRHVVQRNVLGNSAAAVCEVGVEGPTKHVAFVSFVWDQSQEGLQMEATFRARGTSWSSGSASASTSLAATHFARMAGAHPADAPTASELGQSQACGWIAQGISRTTCAGVSDDQQMAESAQAEWVPEPTTPGSATQTQVFDSGSPEQPRLDCGFQRLVSDPGWTAGGTADRPGSFQSLLADYSSAEASTLETCKTDFYSTVSREWLPANHPSGQRSTLRISRAAWAFAPERVVDGSGNSRRIYRSRTPGTERRARANASSLQGRGDPTDFEASARSAAAHRPMDCGLQPDSAPRSFGTKGAHGGLSPPADATPEDNVDISERVGSAPSKEQRADQMAGAQTIYWRSLRWISDWSEVQGQGNICRLFCRLADWRALGFGRGRHATGPVSASVLKEFGTEKRAHAGGGQNPRPACWCSLRSGSLRSPPRSEHEHAATPPARKTKESCVTHVYA